MTTTSKTSSSSSSAARAAEAARKQAEAQRAREAAIAQKVKQQPRAATIADGFGDTRASAALKLDKAATKPAAQSVFKDGFDGPTVPPLTGSKVEGTPGLTIGSDGQVTVSGSATLKPDSIEKKNGNITGTVSAGPMAEANVSLSWKPLEPNADGTFDVSVSIESKVGEQVKGELEGVVGISGSETQGTTNSTTYDLQLSAAELAGVAAGTHPLPTISDPLSLAEGESITTTTGEFEKNAGEISYGPLSIGSDTTKSEDYSVSVERTGESTVRVTVGPSEALERNLELGLSFGDVASVGLTGSTTVEHSKLASAEFDLATPEGKAAYDAFLANGTLPTSTGPGITDSYSEESLGTGQSLGASLKIGEVLNLEHEFWSEDLTYTRRVEDGVATITAEGTSRSGNEFSVSYSENPDGSAKLESVSMDISSGTAGDATITLTGDEGLRSLQDVAFKQAMSSVYDELRYTHLHELGGKTDEEVKAYVTENFPPESHARQLLEFQPGDADFSYEKWLDLYNTDPNRSWQALPRMTDDLLRMGEPDASLAGRLLGGLDGSWAHNDILDPLGGMTDIKSYAELGAGDMPGIDITTR
ncbi:MAG: hypothetical protein ACO1OB_18060 [Archangium sp.]